MLPAVTGGQGQIYSTRKYRKESKHCFFLCFICFICSLIAHKTFKEAQNVLVSAA